MISLGIVKLEVLFWEKVSHLQVAMALQALRDLMAVVFGPREIRWAEFGRSEPWRPVARLAVEFVGI